MRSTVVTAIFLTLGLGVVDTAFGGSLTPIYTSTYYGDTETDNYVADDYERVTAGTEYYEYLDITGADFGSDYKYMYFGIDVYGQNSINTSDGSVSGAFGSGTLYGVRFGSILLRVKGDESGYVDNWVTGSAQGFWNENGDWVDGYETEVITDGAPKDGGPDMLFARIIFNADGSARIELAFDYETWNLLYPNQHLDPAYLENVVFEANRGMKDNTNYLWNENYSESDIYEVDTLTANVNSVPEPGTLSLLAAGLIGLGVFRKRLK